MERSATPRTTEDARSRWPERDRGPTPRKASTRRRLLDAAREVLADRGLAAASVEEICERAGFSRGAFYSNFADKDALVAELLEREERRLVARVEAVTQTPPRAMADIEAALDAFLAARPVDRGFYLIQTELALQAIRDRAPVPTWSIAHSAFKERLSGFLDRVLDGLDRELVVAPDDALELILGLFERSARRALIDGHEHDLDDLTRAVFPRIVQAISRRRPTPAIDVARP